MPRIPFDELKAEFRRVLLKKGCDEVAFDLSAQLIAETQAVTAFIHPVPIAFRA